MKNLFFYVVFACVYVSTPVFSQDVAKEVITKVFYNAKVKKVIFFDYTGKGTWPHKLPDGTFAFIIPDSTFQKQYPDILFDLAMGWGKEKMLSRRTFSARSDGTVFVTNGFTGDKTYKLLIRFDQIKIDNKKALLIFHTTGITQEESMIARYIAFTAHLRKGKSGWKIIHLKLRKIACCEKL